MDKRSDYHFGEHVFSYFPWYSYGDINYTPILKENIWDDFKCAFYDEFVEMPLVWCERGTNYQYALINSEFGYGMQEIMEVFDNRVVKYKGIEETIYDWIDVEKIRLRCILGTEEKAKRYLSIINFYKDQREIINDVIFTESGSEKEVSIITIQEIINRNEKSVFDSLIDVDDVYKCLDKGDCNNYNKFINSIHSYYYKNGRLSEKQIEATKKVLYKEILKSKKPSSFFYVKTDKIENIKRVARYLKTMGLKCKLFNNFMLLY